MAKAKDCPSLCASISVVCGLYSLEIVLILPFDRNSKQFFSVFLFCQFVLHEESGNQESKYPAFKYKIVGRSVFTRKIDLVNSNKERLGAQLHKAMLGNKCDTDSAKI